MEVPDPRQVYNGAQRCGAVVSDIEVMLDTEDEATMPGSTMADRHAMSDDMDLDFEDEVSRRSIEVAVVHSPATVQARGETMCSEITTSAYQRVPATSQQRYDPMRRSETSGRHSRQSDSEVSGIMYARRRGRPKAVLASRASRGIGEQRRSVEDLRAELTDELRFQQAMFLSARDQLAAQQNEAIEGLRGDILRIVNENRQVQSPLAQVSGVEDYDREHS